jgi:hypothetical protein
MISINRTQYNALPAGEREALLGQIAASRSGFTLREMKRFEAFGAVTNTAIFRYKDGRDFVFVPGDTVTLGWDGAGSDMNEETRMNITETLNEYDITDIDQFLRDSCTPVRTVSLPSMLVERDVNEIGWFDVSPDAPAIQANEELRGYLRKYLALANPGRYEWHKTLKLQYRGGGLHAQLYEGIGYHRLLEKIRAAGFDLPSEDEWEYLCGGGARTLWRWGDSYDYTMSVPHFEIETSEKSRNSADPNQFGLVIAFDPYRYEAVSGGNAILKGGDGGGNICGGMGLALGFLPIATYYKGYDSTDDELHYLEDIGGNYTSYRRILRLWAKI